MGMIKIELIDRIPVGVKNTFQHYHDADIAEYIPDWEEEVLIIIRENVDIEKVKGDTILLLKRYYILAAAYQSIQQTNDRVNAGNSETYMALFRENLKNVKEAQENNRITGNSEKTYSRNSSTRVFTDEFFGKRRAE